MIFQLRLLILPLLAFALIGSAAPAHATADKAEIEEIIKNYLMESPEVIIQAMEAYQRNEAKRAEQGATAALDKHYETITAASEPAIGNPEGDVTVIEFLDYNCGYCKKAFPDVIELTEKDANVRVIFQEMPVLGASSVEASKWALAAKKQDKYFEYHTALMDFRGQKNEAAFVDIAEKLGLDVEQLKSDSKSPEIAEILARNQKIARDLNINGTPAFIIDKTFYRGYLGPGGLEKAVNEERAK